MITHPVRDKVAEALAKAGLDSTTVLHLLDDLHQEVRDNDAKLHYPQGREYLINVLTSMQSGTRLSSVDATVTEAVVQIAGELTAASRYAPASDVRPGWTVRVGLAEISVREVFKHDDRSLSLVYFEGHVILANDEPVIVVHRCDTPA